MYKLGRILHLILKKYNGKVCIYPYAREIMWCVYVNAREREGVMRGIDG